MLKTFNLKVELFAVVDIADAARELCELAGRVGVRCAADFNGVQLWARPGDKPEALVQAFKSQLMLPPGRRKIAQAD